MNPLHVITARRERGVGGKVGFRARCTCGWEAKHRAASEELALRRARKHVPVDAIGLAQGALFDG